MQLCDFHVLIPPTWNPVWRTAFFDSIVGEPLNLVIEPAIAGNTTQARFNAFAKGTAKYVSFCDYDDYVEKGALQQCLDHLEANPTLVGVYTNSYTIFGEEIRKKPSSSIWNKKEQFNRPDYIHQLTVMRRDAVMQAIAEYPSGFPVAIEYLLYALITKHGDWHKLPITGYYWRMHGANAHSTNHDIQHHLLARKWICENLSY